MADTKISALTAATIVNPTDSVPIVQGGVNKKANASLLGTSLPFAIVQEAAVPYLASTTVSATFPQTATLNNTLLVFITYASNTCSITTPTGYTQIISQVNSIVGLKVYIKTSAGTETSVSVSTSGSGPASAMYVLEVAGTRALDVSSTTTTSGTPTVWTQPALTPTTGSMVFTVAGMTNNAGVNTGICGITHAGDSWRDFTACFAISPSRPLALGILRGPGAGVALVPPQGYLAGGGILGDSAISTFSIL